MVSPGQNQSFKVRHAFSVHPQFKTSPSVLASRSVFATTDSRQLPKPSLLLSQIRPHGFTISRRPYGLSVQSPAVSLIQVLLMNLRLDRVLPLWERKLTLAMSQSFNQVNKQIEATREKIMEGNLQFSATLVHRLYQYSVLSSIPVPNITLVVQQSGGRIAVPIALTLETPIACGMHMSMQFITTYCIIGRSHPSATCNNPGVSNSKQHAVVHAICHSCTIRG